MKVVSVVSMKGGVGKTSIAACLANALCRRGEFSQVVVLDLDPQNAMQWHLGLGQHGRSGLCRQSLSEGPWPLITLSKTRGLRCLPYGAADEPDRLNFEALLKQQPDWIQRHLHEAGFAEDALVLIDTPPGTSVYLSQAIACSDLALMVLLPDAASYATIPAMETCLEDLIPINPNLRSFYLLNQLDAAQDLGGDVQVMLRHRFNERLAPSHVSNDEAMREALALQQSVLDYDPHGQAADDIVKLAAWLCKELAQ
jgi:cellulose synthase operon protein YhjQ